jgi:hypothetical protein
MEIFTGGARAQVGDSRGLSPALTLVSRPALAQWITAHEVEALREALARGCLPPDFHRKLRGLAGGDLSDRFIEQNCRLFSELLLATEEGSFRAGSRAERERLLRVLAYVRKDQDAIPDYQPGGLKDDQQEVRAAMVELEDLLQAFKAWRLRHQVPGMWSSHALSI